MQNKHQHFLDQQQKAYQQLNSTKFGRFQLITKREDHARRVHARRGHRDRRDHHGLCHGHRDRHDHRGLCHGHRDRHDHRGLRRGHHDHHGLRDHVPRKELLL